MHLYVDQLYFCKGPWTDKRNAVITNTSVQ